MRRFPPPWTVEKIPGGLKVVDATGQSLAFVYCRENLSGRRRLRECEFEWLLNAQGSKPLA
jgi:hypothetical protein